MLNITRQIDKFAKDQLAIGCKWVLNVKRVAGSQVERNKARLVTKRCTQKCAVNFKATVSPVCRMPLCRLALAAKFQLHLHQMDCILK